jgi:protein phosphatase
VTTALLVLVAVIIGGGYIAWRWSQDQYYVATGAKDQVVIYRGINQRIAGISLSSPYELTGIPLAQVPSNYQQTVKTAYASGGLPEVQKVVGNIRTAVKLCQQQYAALQQWVTAENAYTAEVAQAKRQKKPTAGIPGPGPQPSGAAATCPSSQEFGIPASALVPAGPGPS